MTTRKDIFTAVKLRLGEILVVNGFNTDIGKEVRVMPDTPLSEANRDYVPDGAISFDADVESYEYRNNVLMSKMTMVVQAVKPALTNQADVVNDVLADLMKALTKDLTVDAKIRVIQSESGYTQSGNQDMVIVHLTIEIDYKTNLLTE